MRLPFLDPGYEHGPVHWLGDLAHHVVCDRPGVYVLLARPGVTFPYPRRQSSVFYIGQASNLRRRLGTHARFVKEVHRARKLTLYWQMYEYGAAFGCRYTTIVARRRDPRGLEQDVLAMFAEAYRAWPVANTIGGWGSLLSPQQLARRRDAQELLELAARVDYGMNLSSARRSVSAIRWAARDPSLPLLA